MEVGQTYPYRIARRLRTNLENACRFCRFVSKTKSTAPKGHEGTVFLDIPEPKLERYYYLITKFFQLAGWQVNVRFSPNLLLNLRNYSDLIYDVPSLKVVFRKPMQVDLTLGLATTKQKERQLQLDLNYFRKEKEPDAYILPYQMHPDVYHFGIAETLPDVRTSSSLFRILFAGNSGDPYDNPDIEKLFRMVNRKRLNEIVDGMIDGSSFRRIDSKSEFHEHGQIKESTLLLLTKEVKLSIDEWMRALAIADFYIAAPGVSMPFSHNAVEAMAVGAIPIIEYGKMFSPPLEDGVNCVAFSGEDDFIEKIRHCLAMPNHEVARLRAGVIHYYDTYLEPKAVIDRLTENAHRVSKLYVNCEHISVLELKRSL